MSLIKEAYIYYRDRKREERERAKLLSARTDFSLLEKMIQKVNDNPGLEVKVVLNDGTTLQLSTYHKKNKTVYGDINGEEFI